MVERSLTKQQRPRYCKCAFTDPDGTFVPGEACAIHPDVTPQRTTLTSNEKMARHYIGVVGPPLHPEEAQAIIAFTKWLDASLQVETSLSGWQPIHTAPKNGNFLVSLELCPELAWPAHRSDGGPIYSNAHGILNHYGHVRPVISKYWRPMPPTPGSAEETKALPEHVHQLDGNQCHYCHIPLCSTCGRTQTDPEAMICSNPFHLNGLANPQPTGDNNGNKS